jgi:hypothetical protein
MYIFGEKMKRIKILRTLEPQNREKLRLIAIAKNKDESATLDELISGVPESEYKEYVKRKFGF